MLADLARAEESKANNSPRNFLKDCVCNVKRHQWNMRLHRYSDAPADSAERLLNSGVNRAGYKDFEELYSSVREAIKDVKGVGDCAIYDCSLRLGHTLGISPEDFIYIHTRPLAMVKRLAPELVTPGTFRVKRQELAKLFPPLDKLSSSEIEDLLCYMYSELLKP